MGLRSNAGPGRWSRRIDAEGQPLWITVLLILAAFVLLTIVVQLAATWISASETPADSRRVNNARTSLVQLLAGIGLTGGFIYAVRTFSLSRSTQRAERFSKAVEQIGQTSETVRAGGVYSLKLLALEEPIYWPIVEELVCALIRERAKAYDRITSDVQAGLLVLGDRPGVSTAERRALDLRGISLPEAVLVGLNLEGALLDGAHLYNADLTDAQLAHARLVGANLDRANVSKASLESANVSRASLRKSNFFEADLRNANVDGAFLRGALNLNRTQLDSTTGTPAQPPWDEG